MPASRQKDLMTSPQENQAPQVQEQPNNKEINFRKQEAMYQRQLEAAEKRAQEAEMRAQEVMSKRHQQDDNDDDSSEPYVDHKRLSRQLASFERKMDEKIERKSEEKASAMVAKERKESWLRQNPDFYEVLQHADKFAEQDPELAETILTMPEGFDRQKLVYKNIKALGINKPKVAAPSIQEKVDANRRSPYYQPSGVGSAPYAAQGDFSPAGQKAAHAKMQELKNKLRI